MALKRMGIRITAELADRVKEHAEKQNESISVVVENALREYQGLKKQIKGIPSDRPETRGRPGKKSGKARK